MKVVISAAAEADVIALGEWIATDNPPRAESFIAKLEAAALGLGDMPRRFPSVARYRGHHIHKRTVGDYLILYQVSEAEVPILHFLHGARDYETLLDREFGHD